MTIAPVVRDIVHRIQPVHPIQKAPTATEKPKEPLFAGARDEIILLTPQQKAQQLVELADSVKDRKGQEAWLRRAGVEYLSIQGVGPYVQFRDANDREMGSAYSQKRQEQQKLANNRR
jgi:hypothetical protein